MRLFRWTILVAVVAILGLWLTLAGDNCRTRVAWNRNIDSLSPFPEEIRGEMGERVELLECGGEVARIRVRELPVYELYKLHKQGR
jgi:hypothetical protein